MLMRNLGGLWRGGRGGGRIGRGWLRRMRFEGSEFGFSTWARRLMDFLVVFELLERSGRGGFGFGADLEVFLLLGCCS